MNKVILIGRLARDPELRSTSSGVSVTRFTVAVSRNFSSQNGGQPQTDFINCIAWRRQAENIAKYCSKGSQVAVDGRIQTGSYDGGDGQKHYTTDVVADNVTFLGTKSNGEDTMANVSYSQPLPNYSDVQSNYSDVQSMPSTDISEDPFKDFGEEIALSDDDLPF